MQFDYPPGATPLDRNEAEGLLLVHFFNLPRFTWGSEDLVQAGTCREQYIQALQAADTHDYASLLKFVRS